MLDASKLSAKVLGSTYGDQDRSYVRKVVATQVLCVEYHSIAMTESLVAADNWLSEVMMEMAIDLNLMGVKASFGFRREPFPNETRADTLEDHVDHDRKEAANGSES